MLETTGTLAMYASNDWGESFKGYGAGEPDSPFIVLLDGFECVHRAVHYRC
jgi:hypothetical protein